MCGSVGSLRISVDKLLIEHPKTLALSESMNFPTISDFLIARVP